MKRFALLLIFATAASAQIATVPTRCQIKEVPILNDITDAQLIGCADGYADNLAWNLDRSDGLFDMKASRRTNGRGAVVYVLDTGVRQDHDEFLRADGSVVIAGLDPNSDNGFTSKCSDTPALAPCYEGVNAVQILVNTHGTAVASVIAGKHVGIAPDAKIVSVRTQDSAGTNLKVWVDALDQIVRHAWDPRTPQFHTGIINISGGLPTPPRNDTELPKFEAKMRAMIGGVDADGRPDPNGKRFLFVTAAGNLGDKVGNALGQCDLSKNVMLYPGVKGGELDGLVTVGGTTRENIFWTGSCGGPNVDVVAPAHDVLVASMTDRDRYRWLPAFFRSGTSYSTPYVSAMAARWLELEPTLTPVELEQRLKTGPAWVDGWAMPVMPVLPKRRAN